MQIISHAVLDALTLDTLSRLKGIETFRLATWNQVYIYFRSAFPFEGN